MIELRTPDLHTCADLEQVALQVARACARLLVDERPTTVTVAATKSSETDIVTLMDHRSQALAEQMIAEQRPEDGRFGEEGMHHEGSSGITWVVDPIDGTVNYLYALPNYCVSVAAVVGDPSKPGQWRPVAGAVVSPLLGETFFAHRGGGARRYRGRTATNLHWNGAETLAQSLVGTGFGYESAVRAEQARVLTRVLPAVRDIRRAGSAALDLCHVADGQLDAYYERGVNPWDIAAGWLICTEAGVTVRGLDGDPDHELTLAGSRPITTELAALLRA